MDGDEELGDVCYKCKSLVNDDQYYECDSCLSRIHRNCSIMSASEIKCMPLQRRMLVHVCDTCKILMKRIPFMIGIIDKMRSEISELKGIVSNSCKKGDKSYAQITSEKVEIDTNKKVNIPSLIIKPKNVQRSSKTKDDLLKTVNPVNMNIGIRSMKTVKNGSVIVKCTSREKVEVLKKAVTETLKDAYEVDVTKLRNPRIKIANYEGHKNAKELEECLRKQNDWITNDDYVSVTYVRKKRNMNSTIFAECSPVMFQKFAKFKKVYIEWQCCPVYEDINPIKCFNCLGFYHKSNNCENKRVCDYCAGEHGLAECSKTSKKCNNCMEANIKFKFNYSVSHTSSDPECPTLQYHINILRSKIDYNCNPSNRY